MSAILNSDVLTVAGRIQWVRQKTKSNMKNFAQELGITRNYLSVLEHGKRQPSDELLQKIADLGDVSFQWMKEGSGSAKEDTVNTVPALPQNPGEQARIDRLFLHILRHYQPKIFPDTMSYILKMEPAALEKFMEGEIECSLEREDLQVLAKRLDSDKVVREMGAVERFITESNTITSIDVIKKAIKDYLNQFERGAYTWGELMDGEDGDSCYELPDCTVEVSTLTCKGRRQGMQDGTAVFRFQYVRETKGTAPNRQYGFASSSTMIRYKEVANLRLPKLKPGRKKKPSPDEIRREIFVFTNDILYESFAECLAAIQRERESRSASLATAGLPSLLLLDVNQGAVAVKRDIQPLPPFAITSVRDYLSNLDGSKLANNAAFPQLGEYPALHAHEYFLSFEHDAPSKDEEPVVLYPFYFVDRDQPNTAVEPGQGDSADIMSNLQDPIEKRFLSFRIPAVTYTFRDRSLYQRFTDCAKTLQDETGPIKDAPVRPKCIFLLLDEECRSVLDNMTFQL